MHSQFPSNETLAAFIDGRLDSRTRSRVAQHLIACDDCYAMVADARAAREAIGEAAFEPRGFATPDAEGGKLLPFPLIAAAVAVAAGLAAAVFFIPSLWDFVHGTPSVAAVVESSDQQRVTLTRIAEMKERRPPAPVMRGGGDGASSDTGGRDERPELQSKEAELQTASADHPTRRNLHALGVALLLDKKTDEAIQVLEHAAQPQFGPPDADLLNDLAAAYTDRRVKRGAPRAPAPDDAPQVLEATERAWKFAKTPATGWNRALALEMVGHDAEAKTAWQQYLQLETDTRWREEAVQRLKDLNEFSAPP
jgi:hypothetical protein